MCLWRVGHRDCSFFLISPYIPPYDKTNKWHVRPAKTDLPGYPPSLIRVFTVRMKKDWVLSYPLSAQRRLMDPQAVLILFRAHVPFCWFCREMAHYHFISYSYISRHTRKWTICLFIFWFVVVRRLMRNPLFGLQTCVYT